LEDFLLELNEQQRKAVEYTEGPSLIIAGAGSGKTRVLTTRIAYLVSQGIDPFNILALTFTNKAAHEMRKRIEKMAGKDARNIWMGTFHSVFARILRNEALKLGYTHNFSIYDTEDSKSLVRTIINEDKLDNKLYKPSFVYNRISRAKNSFISPRQYLEDPEIMTEDMLNGRPKLGELYLKYTQRCFKAVAMDFDDLLLKTHELLDKFPEALNKYQHHFNYVLIDEFQDTNLVQYLIVKKLSAVHRNLCVVGDDAQSIYSFRGATIKNILNFENDYPELKVFKLEQNYRSTQTIVSASGNVIDKNKFQLKKNLWTVNQSGSKIKIFKCSSENDEGFLVAQSIMNEHQTLKLRYKDFVILYRTNAQSRAFEESLRRFELPYRIVGGLSFYQRKEIKDLLAYYRVIYNQNDEEALKRIINFPARGIGDTTFAKILVYASENKVTLWDVISNIKQYPIGNRFTEAISDFYMLIKSFMVICHDKDAYEAAHYVAKHTGILKLLHEDKSLEGIGRYDNVQNMLSAIKEFTTRNDITDFSLLAFLNEVSLLTDFDMQSDDDDKVTLMTIHSAKGLEFSIVYIVGLEENLFPSIMSSGSREEIEEERRLFYVALTRAQKKAFLTYAITRFKWGNIIYCEPSRFLDDVDKSHIEFSEPEMDYKPVSIPKKETPSYNLIQKKTINDYKPSGTFVPGDISKVEVGMDIEHEKFGPGKVLRLDGPATNKKATIFFDLAGQKNILLRYAKMRIIDKKHE